MRNCLMYTDMMTGGGANYLGHGLYLSGGTSPPGELHYSGSSRLRGLH